MPGKYVLVSDLGSGSCTTVMLNKFYREAERSLHQITLAVKQNLSRERRQLNFGIWYNL